MVLSFFVGTPAASQRSNQYRHSPRRATLEGSSRRRSRSREGRVSGYAGALDVPRQRWRMMRGLPTAERAGRRLGRLRPRSASPGLGCDRTAAYVVAPDAGDRATPEWLSSRVRICSRRASGNGRGEGSDQADSGGGERSHRVARHYARRRGCPACEVCRVRGPPQPSGAPSTATSSRRESQCSRAASNVQSSYRGHAKAARRRAASVTWRAPVRDAC